MLLSGSMKLRVPAVCTQLANIAVEQARQLKGEDKGGGGDFPSPYLEKTLTSNGDRYTHTHTS